MTKVVSDEQEKKLLVDHWSFSWPIMNVLIGGLSSIDLPDLLIQNEAEAKEFLFSYGYDPDNADDARFIHATIIEALHFIEHHLMTAEWKRGLQPPKEILLCTDARKLIVWASNRSPEANECRIWSCAILRVLHTIAHIEGVFSYASIDKAREDIWSRYQKIISRDDQGQLWLGDDTFKVLLEKIDWKAQKSRESILLKLLHKRANVAENIYDMVGIRIVTKRFCDVLSTVKFLYKFNAMSFPNVIPSRSRNSLIDLNIFRARIDTLRGELQTGLVTTREFNRALEYLEVPPPDEAGVLNLHSDQDYRAIQLTCRQLVRSQSAVSKLCERFESGLKEDKIPGSESNLALAENLKYLRDQIGNEDFAFFPYELQITNQKNYIKNSSGRASHSRYKRSQLKAARRRILNEILPQ